MPKQSSIRVAPVPLGDIFGVRPADLQILLADALGDPQKISGITIEHEKQGFVGGANSFIATVHYRSRSGAAGKLPIFVKQARRPEVKESSIMVDLSERGISVPKLHAVHVPENGLEIMFMEFLPEIGVDRDDPFEAEQVINLVAGLCAAPIPERYQDHDQTSADDELHPKRLFDAIDRAWALGGAGQLGEALSSFCDRHASVASDLRGFYPQVVDRWNQFPNALNHTQLSDHQLGWRHLQDGKQIVLFDFDALCLTRRFVDISAVIVWLQAGVFGHEQLQKMFLKQFNSLAKQPIREEDLRFELLWTQIFGSYWSIEWCTEMALSSRYNVTGNPEDGRRYFRDELLQNLQFLQSSATTHEHSSSPHRD